MTPLRRIAACTIAVGALLTVSACSGTSVLSLEVGQCFTGQTDGEEEVSSVPVVDCAEPHVGEFYSLPQLPDGDYPGAEALQTTADELCAGADFQTYVGKSYQESEIYYSFLVPTEASWATGDHEIACFLTADEAGSETTGSLRGANR